MTAKTESAVKDVDTHGQSVVLGEGRLVRRINFGWVELGGGFGPKWRQNWSGYGYMRGACYIIDEIFCRSWDGE